MAHTKQQSTLESEFKKALEMNRTLYEQNCRLNNETALVKEAAVNLSKDISQLYGELSSPPPKGFKVISEAENNYVQNAV